MSRPSRRWGCTLGPFPASIEQDAVAMRKLDSDEKQTLCLTPGLIEHWLVLSL